MRLRDDDVPCCTPEFWIFLAICLALVSFAGITSGLALGLLSFGQVDLEVLIKAGQPHESKYAGCDQSYARWFNCAPLFSSFTKLLPRFRLLLINQQRFCRLWRTSICFCAPFSWQSHWQWRYIAVAPALISVHRSRFSKSPNVSAGTSHFSGLDSSFLGGYLNVSHPSSRICRGIDWKLTFLAIIGIRSRIQILSLLVKLC